MSIYPGWTQYERRAAHREIGVFVLSEGGLTGQAVTPAGITRAG